MKTERRRGAVDAELTPKHVTKKNVRVQKLSVCIGFKVMGVITGVSLRLHTVSPRSEGGADGEKRHFLFCFILFKLGSSLIFDDRVHTDHRSVLDP